MHEIKADALSQLVACRRQLTGGARRLHRLNCGFGTECHQTAREDDG